nr:unknown [Shuttle vector pFNLTP1]AAT44343.1 unknown [Temperature-sensitive shuttle vector pFNLTP9]
MQTVNYSTFRNELSDSMDRVTKNHSPMIVTRGSKKEAVVMMSLEDSSLPFSPRSPAFPVKL